jgi:hypothetical protein
LKLSHIATISGYSRSTVMKVLYGEKYRKRFKKETVDQILWVRDYEKTLDSIFEGELFQKMCKTVARKLRKSHSKNFENVLDLALTCRFIIPAQDNIFFTRKIAGAIEILTDENFAEMCELAKNYSNCSKTRELALDLSMQSRAIIFKLGLRKKKSKQKGVIN